MSTPSSSALETPRLVSGRYAVEACLGRGGMGEVYRALDVRTGQKLALKRSRTLERGSAQRRRASLEREYYTLAQLSHPSIIAVYDYGVDDEGPYYTMELLDGADLDGGRLPWREAAALLRDVASSLAVLHSRGLLHRDVSARNVRRTADGHAKLIDFGAMASIGVPSEVVGTPPFMAPEVLQMQALDVRADLFSLGALAYYAITGRHAFPARRLSDLRDVWRSKPTAPMRLQPDVPSALSDLIMQLLALDRGSRPQSAAEVIGRLCASANLPLEDLSAVTSAYLYAPLLVGRDAPLKAVRGRTLSLLRGSGGALLAFGPAGSGRSRLLDACLLEARLLGASVLRADAADSGGTDYGAARAIGRQLVELFPDAAHAAARLSLDVLGQVIDELRPPLSVVGPKAERSLLLRELRDFVLAVTRNQRVVFAIDDVDRLDEPSQALLGALIDQAERQSLLLALSMDPASLPDANPSLQVLARSAQRIELSPLQAEETEALLRSVFGDVANLQLCAARIHDLAQGNPRTSMELAQHLVDRGLARYVAGSWLLPAQLDEGDLPRTLAASLAARLTGLSADARELADAFSLLEQAALPVDRYPLLTSHREPRRVFLALQELATARVLVALRDDYRFSQTGFVGVIQERMSLARSQTLHARLAEAFDGAPEDFVRRAHHMILGGREAEAVRLLCSRDIALMQPSPPMALLERAVDAAERDPALPPRALHLLRMAILLQGPLSGAIESFHRCLAPVLVHLERASGLATFHELVDVPADQRLGEALRRQQESFDALPAALQVSSPFDAIRELTKLSAAVGGWAVVFSDLTLLENFPSLQPFVALSPAIGMVFELRQANQHAIAGRVELSSAHYEVALARVSEADRAGLDEASAMRTRLSISYALGMSGAMLGQDEAEQHAQVLESERSMRVAAWRVRMLMHLSQGNVDASRRCLRKAEVLQLQDGLLSFYSGTTAAHEVVSRAALGDVVGVQACLEILAVRAQRHPGWRPIHAFGRARYREMQGDLAGALELVEAGLAMIQPGRHPSFGNLASCRVRVLAALGRIDEAIAEAHRYSVLAERERMITSQHALALELAPLLSLRGQHDAAVATIDPAIEWMQERGSSGFALGRYYAARARIALAARDQPGLDRNFALAAREYRKANNPNLNAQLTRMLEQAEQQALAPSEQTRELISLAPVAIQTEYDSLHSKLIECVDIFDRARCALHALLESAEADVGYLYGVNGERVTALASLPRSDPNAALESWVEQWLNQARVSPLEGDHTATHQTRRRRGQADSEEPMTATVSDEPPSPAPARFEDATGHSYEAFLIATEYEAAERIAAVLILQVDQAQRRRPSHVLAADVARQLLERKDVSGSVL